MKKLILLTIGAFLYAAPLSAQNWELVWSDEFNGSSVNTNNWTFEEGDGCPDLCGWGNNELQYYRAENATVSGGHLIITAKKESFGGREYTSARLKTQGKREFQYGKIEARAKIPMVQGLWAAFWALGSNIGQVGWPASGEIDIMEHINTDSNTHGVMHWDFNGHQFWGGDNTHSPGDWHVYTIEWDNSAIRWYVDGVQFHEGDITINDTEEFHQPFFLLLNLAVGGNWPGHTIDDSSLPAEYRIDWVRVYQADGGGSNQTPFTTHNIPGTVQGEDFDNGGEGVAYHDTDSGNNGGAYRSTDVDIESTGDAGGGYNVGWIADGEWLEYTVSNITAGTYDINLRTASAVSGSKSIAVTLNGANLGTVNPTNTGGWQNWQTLTLSGVSISGGSDQILRLDFGGGSFNVNHVEFVEVGGGGGVCSGTEADFDYSVDASTVTFTSKVSSDWADLHYIINNGVQLNVRMEKNGDIHTYDHGAGEGDVIDFSFTYWDATIGGAKDSPWFNCTIGSSQPKVSTSSKLKAREELPKIHSLSQNYPNPFNPSTVISYQLPSSEHVTLEVFNLAGQKVATLVDRQQAQGRYRVPFDASGLSSGVYLYKIQAGSFTETRKMILLK